MQTVKDKLLVLSEDYENGTAVLFSLDLKSFRWTRMASVSLKSNKRPTSLSSLGPPARGNPTISLTKGGHLLIIGGHNRNESRYPGQLKAIFFSERMFSCGGFSLLRSEYPLFLHFPGLFFKIFLC